MKRPSARWPVIGAQLAIVGLVLCFLVRTVVSLWPQIRGTEWRPSPPLLVGSLAVGVLCQALLVVGWRLSLRLAGAPIPWRGAVVSQVLGQLAKYVPGKVLTLVGKAYLASRSGVPVSRRCTIRGPFRPHRRNKGAHAGATTSHWRSPGAASPPGFEEPPIRPARRNECTA